MRVKLDYQVHEEPQAHDHQSHRGYLKNSYEDQYELVGHYQRK